MGELVGERRRETEKERKREIEREKRGSETDVPKLYTYNEYEHSVKFGGRFENHNYLSSIDKSSSKG